MSGSDLLEHVNSSSSSSHDRRRANSFETIAKLAEPFEARRKRFKPVDRNEFEAAQNQDQVYDFSSSTLSR